MTTTPAIFYAPHQDDEAIAMAGAIAEHKDAGRPVFLVLITDGRPGRRMQQILNGERACGWHERRHDFDVSEDQLIWARTMEFMASAQALDVDRVFTAGLGGVSDSEPYDDYGRFVGRVADLVLALEGRYPGSSHKLVSGYLEADVAGPNPTHVACWDAAQQLRSEITDFRFYRVYEYYKPRAERGASWRQPLTPSQLGRKRAALDAYKRFDPGQRRYGYGYHSVPDLIQAAYEDDAEYIDF